MDKITEIMSLLTNNYDSILIVISAIITTASVIVKLTPSETDNAKLAKVVKVFEALSLNSQPVEKIEKK